MLLAVCLACIILSYCTQLPSFIHFFFSVIFQFLSLLFSWISLFLTSSKCFPNMSLVLSCFSKLPPLASLPFSHCIHRSAHVYTHLMSVHTQRNNTPTSSFVQYFPPPACLEIRSILFFIFSVKGLGILLSCLPSSFFCLQFSVSFAIACSRKKQLLLLYTDCKPHKVHGYG